MWLNEFEGILTPGDSLRLVSDIAEVKQISPCAQIRGGSKSSQIT
jgi:hypothetical protein